MSNREKHPRCATSVLKNPPQFCFCFNSSFPDVHIPSRNDSQQRGFSWDSCVLQSGCSGNTSKSDIRDAGRGGGGGNSVALSGLIKKTPGN